MWAALRYTEHWEPTQAKAARHTHRQESGIPDVIHQMSLIRERAESRAIEQLKVVCGPTIFREKYQGYTILPEQNLIPRIERNDFWQDLDAGAGSELKDSARGPAKFCAAFSSSALVVNAFAPFRHRPKALEIAGIQRFDEACFEKTLPTGLGGTPPHLDFYASGPSQVVCIESKFLEPLWPKAAKFAESYEGAIESLAESSWAEVYRGLKTDPQQFEFLDTAQLVKHYLGMRYNLAGNGKKLVLLYVFWEPENVKDLVEFRQHREEVGLLSRAVQNSAVRFVALSYKQLWNDWKCSSNWSGLRQHVSNLEDRYTFSI